MDSSGDFLQFWGCKEEFALAGEIIDDGVDGFVVPIQSPEAIAEKLALLMQDKEKAAEMGGLAAQKVKALNDWEGYTGKLIELYEKLVSSQGSG